MLLSHCSLNAIESPKCVVIIPRSRALKSACRYAAHFLKLQK